MFNINGGVMDLVSKIDENYTSAKSLASAMKKFLSAKFQVLNSVYADLFDLAALRDDRGFPYNPNLAIAAAVNPVNENAFLQTGDQLPDGGSAFIKVEPINPKSVRRWAEEDNSNAVSLMPAEYIEKLRTHLGDALTTNNYVVDFADTYRQLCYYMNDLVSAAEPRIQTSCNGVYATVNDVLDNFNSISSDSGTMIAWLSAYDETIEYDDNTGSETNPTISDLITSASAAAKDATNSELFQKIKSVASTNSPVTTIKSIATMFVSSMESTMESMPDSGPGVGSFDATYSTEGYTSKDTLASVAVLAAGTIKSIFSAFASAIKTVMKAIGSIIKLGVRVVRKVANKVISWFENPIIKVNGKSDRNTLDFPLCSVRMDVRPLDNYDYPYTITSDSPQSILRVVAKQFISDMFGSELSASSIYHVLSRICKADEALCIDMKYCTLYIHPMYFETLDIPKQEDILSGLGFILDHDVLPFISFAGSIYPRDTVEGMLKNIYAALGYSPAGWDGFNVINEMNIILDALGYSHQVTTISEFYDYIRDEIKTYDVYKLQFDLYVAPTAPIDYNNDVQLIRPVVLAHISNYYDIDWDYQEYDDPWTGTKHWGWHGWPTCIGDVDRYLDYDLVHLNYRSASLDPSVSLSTKTIAEKVDYLFPPNSSDVQFEWGDLERETSDKAMMHLAKGLQASLYRFLVYSLLRANIYSYEHAVSVNRDRFLAHVCCGEANIAYEDHISSTRQNMYDHNIYCKIMSYQANAQQIALNSLPFFKPNDGFELPDGFINTLFSGATSVRFEAGDFPITFNHVHWIDTVEHLQPGQSTQAWNRSDESEVSEIFAPFNMKRAMESLSSSDTNKFFNFSCWTNGTEEVSQLSNSLKDNYLNGLFSILVQAFAVQICTNKPEYMKLFYEKTEGATPAFVPYNEVSETYSHKYHLKTFDELLEKQKTLGIVFGSIATVITVAAAAVGLKWLYTRSIKKVAEKFSNSVEAARYDYQDILVAYNGGSPFEFFPAGVYNYSQLNIDECEMLLSEYRSSMSPELANNLQKAIDGEYESDESFTVTDDMVFAAVPTDKAKNFYEKDYTKAVRRGNIKSKILSKIGGSAYTFDMYDNSGGDEASSDDILSEELQEEEVKVNLDPVVSLIKG